MGRRIVDISLETVQNLNKKMKKLEDLHRQISTLNSDLLNDIVVVLKIVNIRLDEVESKIK